MFCAVVRHQPDHLARVRVRLIRVAARLDQERYDFPLLYRGLLRGLSLKWDSKHALNQRRKFPRECVVILLLD